MEKKAPAWHSKLLDYSRRSFPTKAFIQGKIALDAPFSVAEARFYGKALKMLSDHFNGIEQLAAVNYFNLKEYQAAYLLYFFPANWAKIEQILGETAQHFAPQDSFRILDLGSGPAPMSLGSAYFLRSFFAQAGKSPSFHLHCIDHSKAALHHAMALSRLLLDAPIQCSTQADRISLTTVARLPDHQYDLIILGDFLNELDTQHRFDLVSRCLTQKLRPHGQLILVEPALQRTSRNLQALRDLLLREVAGSTVLAPCLRQGTCPLNHYNRRDWCHFYSDWPRPAWLDGLEKAAGLHKEWLKFSYLTFNHPSPLAEEGGRRPGEGNLWRVISNPMKSKGKQELVLCGPQGRIHLTGQYRLKSTQNGDFFHLYRGDKATLIPSEWPKLRSGMENWDYRLHLTSHSRIFRQ